MTPFRPEGDPASHRLLPGGEDPSAAPDPLRDPLGSLLCVAFPVPGDDELAQLVAKAPPVSAGLAARASRRALAERSPTPPAPRPGVLMPKSAAKKPATPSLLITNPPPPRRAITIGGVGLGTLTAFTQQLSTLQDAGLPIVRSLRILEGQQRAGVLKNALLDVSDDVTSGATLSEALARHPRCFDRLYVGMIRAGEAGGVLDTILERLAGFMEKSLRLKKKVLGALIYPAVVTVVAVAILTGILKFVIPAFSVMFEESGIPLPAMTELLIGASNAVVEWWFLLPILPIAAVVFLRGVRSTPRGKYMLDRLALRVPVFGTIVRKSAVARFARTLGTLIASGVPILESLGITREATTNDVIVKAIDEVHTSIREGESVATPLAACGAFDDMFVNMIAIGEETGELDRLLSKVADTYEGDVDVAVESLSSIVEPILIIGMGGAIGFIVIALFLPLITLIETL